jgi:Protein of unknown function (DUF3500)
MNRISVVLVLTVVSAKGTGLVAHERPTSVPADASSTGQMTQAAQALFKSLSDEQRKQCSFSIADEKARTRWSNLPASMVERGGVRVGDLNDEQRILLHDLLRASTSSQGYHKIAGVIRLDDLLHDQASAAAAGGRSLPKDLVESFSSRNYWLSFFGVPGQDANWGFLITGHHLGASFTVAGDRATFTPLFLGAEPHVVKSGPEAGWMVLSHEVERGFSLLRSLSDDQRRRAVLSETVPVLSGPGRKDSLNTFVGLPASALSSGQQALLWALIQEYVEDADHDVAEVQLQKIEKDGLAKVFFAWMGPLEAADQRYYYRVHGPSILIEYVRERSVGAEPANHVHTIVRDPSNDYGEDWLARHYKEYHQPR